MSARIFDTNGWYEIAANPITRVGVFSYLGSSIKAPNPTKMYAVLRGADELSDPATLDSFRLLPLVNDHTMLGTPTTAGNTYMAAEQKGVHGVLGDNVWFNAADGVVYSNLKMFSQTLGRAIDGGKRELSMGYKCLYDWTPGVWNGIPYDCRQYRIRGNHVALVPDGRMGDDVAVMDGEIIGLEVFTFDEKDARKVIKLKNDKPKAYEAFVKNIATTIVSRSALGKAKKFAIATMDADDTADVASDPTLADIADLLGDVMPQIADINASLTTGTGGDDDMEDVLDAAGKAVMDAAGLTMKKKKTPPAKNTDPAPGKTVATVDGKDTVVTMDVATMDAAIAKAVAAAVDPLNVQIEMLKGGVSKGVFVDIAKRDALVTQLKPFVGTFDHAEMSLNEVAQYGVKKLEIPSISGQEYSAVTAYLHGRKPATATHTVATMDSEGKPRKSSVSAFINGDDTKAA